MLFIRLSIQQGENVKSYLRRGTYLDECNTKLKMKDIEHIAATFFCDKYNVL